MTAKKSTKTGKNFRGGRGNIFLVGQNIYPWLARNLSSIKGKILPQILDTGVTNAAFKGLEARQGVRAYATPIKGKVITNSTY